MVLLLVRAASCPVGTRPRRAWYVPGASARLGAGGIRRAWRGYFEEDPPTERTIRAHLRVLEDLLALVRSPGDWLPVRTSSPLHRPRYPDTLHLVETDIEAEWWVRVGGPRLDRDPRAERNPDRWRARFGRWRAEARSSGDASQGSLFDAPPGGQEGRGTGVAAIADVLAGLLPPGKRMAETRTRPAGELPSATGALALARVVRGGAHALEVLAHLRLAGAQIRGPNYARLAESPARLRGAAALFVHAILRGDRIRSPGGWVVRAFDAAPRAELDAAIARLGTGFTRRSAAW